MREQRGSKKALFGLPSGGLLLPRLLPRRAFAEVLRGAGLPGLAGPRTWAEAPPGGGAAEVLPASVFVLLTGCSLLVAGSAVAMNSAFLAGVVRRPLLAMGEDLRESLA